MDVEGVLAAPPSASFVRPQSHERRGSNASTPQSGFPGDATFTFGSTVASPGASRAMGAQPASPNGGGGPPHAAERQDDADSLGSLEGELFEDLEAKAIQQARELDRIQRARARAHLRETDEAERRAMEVQASVRALEQKLRDERKERLSIQQNIAKLRKRQEEWSGRLGKASEGKLALEREAIVDQLATRTLELKEIREKREALQRELSQKDAVVRLTEQTLVQRYNKPVRPVGVGPTVSAELDRFGDEAGNAPRTHAYTQYSADEYHAIDEILAQRRYERARSETAHAERIRELNAQRFELVALREQLHAQVEGDANAADDGGEDEGTGAKAAALALLSDPVHDGSVEAVVAAVRHTLPAHEQQLEKMRQQKQRADAIASAAAPPPYAGEYGLKSYRQDQMPLYYWMRLVVDGIVARAFDVLFNQTNTTTGLQKSNDDWRQHEQLLRDRLRLEAEEKAYRVIMQEIVRDIAGEACEDVARDVWTNKAWAADMAATLLIKATLFAGSRLDEKTLQKTSSELRRRRRRDGAVNHHSFKLRTRAVAVDAAGNVTSSTSEPASAGDDEDDPSEKDVRTGNPFSDLHTEPPSAEQAEDEIDYWAGVSIVPVFVDTKTKYEGIVTVSGSLDGRFLAVQPVRSGLCVYDLRQLPPMLIRKDTASAAKGKEAVSIHWSYDGCSLLALLPDGAVAVYSLRHNGGAQMISDSGEFIPPPLSPVTTIPPLNPSGKGRLRNAAAAASFNDMFATAGPSDFDATCTCFHPSFTLLGTQPSVMVGLERGVIIKHNTGDAALVIHGAVLKPADDFEGHSFDDPSFSKREDIPYEGTSQSVCNVVGAAGGGGAAAAAEQRDIPPHEFFVGHRNPVCFLGHYQMSTTMVSMDSSGLILLWPYEELQFTGFGWFVPSDKFQLDLNKTTYERKERSVPTQHFPPPSFKMPRNPSGNVGALALCQRTLEEFMRSMETLGLRPEPWAEYYERKTKRTVKVFATVTTRDAEEFHTLEFDDKGVLVAHSSQPWVKKLVPGEILKAHCDSTGRQLVVVVQYPALPQRETASVIAFQVDLRTLSMIEPRLDIPLDEGWDGVLDFAVSPVVPGTGCAYLYMLLDASVFVYSLGTGQRVVDDPLLPLSYSGREASLRDVTVIGANGNVCITALDSPILYLYDVDADVMDEDEPFDGEETPAEDAGDTGGAGVSVAREQDGATGGGGASPAASQGAADAGTVAAAGGASGASSGAGAGADTDADAAGRGDAGAGGGGGGS